MSSKLEITRVGNHKKSRLQEMLADIPNTRESEHKGEFSPNRICTKESAPRRISSKENPHRRESRTKFLKEHLKGFEKRARRVVDLRHHSLSCHQIASKRQLASRYHSATANSLRRESVHLGLISIGYHWTADMVSYVWKLFIGYYSLDAISQGTISNGPLLFIEYAVH